MLSNRIQAPKINLVNIQAGEFTMGRMDGYAHSGREDPAHQVTLAEYQIGKYPVTNAEYRLFAQDTGHRFKDGIDDHPASGITWQSAWLFCAWMRYKTGDPYHLTTEAEWEKAATWNPQTKQKQPYPWGFEETDQYCNVKSSGPNGTTPIGKYSPRGDSPYGCADMIGNVDEWCNTALREYPYNTDDGCEELIAQGPRAIRGGDWYTLSPPTAIRRNVPSDAWVGLWGFRIALGNSLNLAHDLYQQKLQTWLEKTKAERLKKIEQEPNNAQIYYDLGAWYISLSQMGVSSFSRANIALTKALELVNNKSNASLKSPLAWVYYNRAYARHELQQFREALEDASKAINLDTTDGDAYMLRASIHIKLSLWEKAEQDLQKSLKINPKNHQHLIIQSLIATVKKDYETALNILTEIINNQLIFPLKRPDIHLQRGQIYEQLGKTHEAMSDYCHCLLWNPNTVDASILKQKLAEYRLSQ